MTPSEDLLVTKAEALQLVNDHINKAGVIDVPVLEELFAWRDKLELWLHKEREAN